MIEIIPAIMPRSFQELREAAESVNGLVGTAQIDIMDGIFVPEKSWPYSEDEMMLSALVKDDDGFPCLEELGYEIDLMIKKPEESIENWVSLCASRLILHIESLPNPRETFSIVRGYLDTAHGGRDAEKQIELGVAIDIDTPNEHLNEVMPFVSFIQCMGIAKIGYQGNPFDPRVIPKVKDLRELYPDVIISIDGGVNSESIPQLVEAGANRLVAGSAIFGSNDIGEAIDDLRRIANSSQASSK